MDYMLTRFMLSFIVLLPPCFLQPIIPALPWLTIPSAYVGQPLYLANVPIYAAFGASDQENAYGTYVAEVFFESTTTAPAPAAPTTEIPSIARAAVVENDDDILLDNLAKQNLGWISTKNYFYNQSDAEKRTHLGAKILPRKNLTQPVPVVPQNREAAVNKRSLLPESFDARKNWPVCSSTISDVRDQGRCGACWAHSSASVISDLICIQSAGKSKFKISTQDLITCMPAIYVPPEWTPYNDLCQGFDAQTAMRMFINMGIVSGGEHSEPTTGCMPYSNSSYYNGTNKACKISCSDSDYPKTFQDDKIFSKSFGIGKKVLIMGASMATTGLSPNTTYTVDPVTGDVDSQDSVSDTTENLIKEAIMTGGSVTSSFDVHNDFMFYSSGVYRLSANTTLLGGHAIKLIGWGATAGGEPYWLGVNSWNTSWGENGLFRILRGSNHANIENYIVTLT